MIRSILRRFGCGIRYRDRRGTYDYRYDSHDFAMERPIHETMSVALPTAKREFYRLKGGRE